ncbi:MAG: rhodanese-like domain-containing protein [Minisyncoccia bacterium]
MTKYLYIGIGLVAIITVSFIFYKPSVGGLLSSADFIQKYKATPNAVLIDVRTPAEFNSGHISTAINIDYDNQSLFKEEIKKLDPAKTYFVYCRSGNRSSGAVAQMKNASIRNIYELQNGLASAPELLNY